MAGASKIWALRMPGGPTKVIRSKTEIGEEQAQKIYLKSFSFVSTETKRGVEWPLSKPIDEEAMKKDFAKFIELSNVTGKPRALVEV